MITCGAQQAFINAALSLLDADSPAILLAPFYMSHRLGIQLAGARVVVASFNPTSLKPDIILLKHTMASLDKAPRMVVLTNPGNPSGTVLSEQEIGEVVEACREYPINDVAYDPYNGQQLSEEISQEGITIASMAQNCSMFHEPINDFMQAMQDGRLTHTGCPLLRWSIGNAVLVRDRNDRWMFDKRSSNDKIDPVVAMVMAYRRAMVAPQRPSGSLCII